MALSFFSRCYHFFLFVICRYFPAYFAQKVCGRLVFVVFVSRFPVIFLDYSEPAGWYFVDSFIFLHTGELQIGLEIERGSVEYYSLSDLVVSNIGFDSDQIAVTSIAAFDFKTA